MTAASLLVLHHIDQAANVRQDLHDELVAVVQQLLRLLGEAHTGRRTRDDESARLQGCSLGNKADDLRNRKDKVTATRVSKNIPQCHPVR